MDQRRVKKLLDDVGPGFCLAKWTQTTINLGLGETQSCHHNSFHVIPLSEIKRSSSALHNTEEKKRQRKLMLSGGKPPECNYCWRVEENSNYFSDRVLMSNKFNALDYYDQIKNSTGDEDFHPTQLEVAFSSVCNFACAYCGPSFSSKWYSDISKNGPYLDGYINISKSYILEKEDNPYVNAFWEYLPSIYSTLHTLRITGGEPLMSKHTKKLLDYIKTHPNKDLTLIINTNLGVPDPLFFNFLEDIKSIRGNVKEVCIATSGEAVGKHAEYIRDGLDYAVWYQRCEAILSQADVKLSFMCAYNLLSITTFTNFLKGVKTLYDKFGKVGLSITSVTHPEFLSVAVAPVEWRHYLEETLKYLEENSPGEATDRFKHVMSHFDEPKRPDLLANLEQFLVEYDQRRGKNFKETFPEYSFIKI